MVRRIFGWLLLVAGCVVVALGAFMAWSTWDMTSWGFDSISPTATLAAGLGAIALAVALVLLRGRPRGAAIAVGVLGVVAVALAIDLFARNAGGSLFGDAHRLAGKRRRRHLLARARVGTGGDRDRLARRRHVGMATVATPGSAREHDLAELVAGLQPFERRRELLERQRRCRSGSRSRRCRRAARRRRTPGGRSSSSRSPRAGARTAWAGAARPCGRSWTRS